MSRLGAAAAAITLWASTLLVTACGSGGVRADPILDLSAEESLATGKSFYSDEKYARARPYLVHAYEVEPNSANGREALLLSADTFFLEGGRTNYIQAEAKYRDFLNRFPTSDRAPYAQLQIANSLAQAMENPDRDQTNTRKALAAYEELMRLYPTSENAVRAREQIRMVRSHLAEHEYGVGRFYLRLGLSVAAISRLEGLLEDYPEYLEKDKVLLQLGSAYSRARRYEDADETFGRLESQFPESEYLDQAREIAKKPREETPLPMDSSEDGEGEGEGDEAEGDDEEEKP